MKTLLKVLENNKKSPFKKFQYELNRWYHCEDFDDDPKKDCTHGYYATDIEGLPYTYRPSREVWWCEVDGKSVEYDIYKRRYERIRITCRADLAEIKQMAVSREWTCGYKLSEIIFPFNPLKVFTEEEVTREIVTPLTIDRLRKWASIRDSLHHSTKHSIINSIRNSIWCSVIAIDDTIIDSIWCSVSNSTEDFTGCSIINSIRDSIDGYISSLFPKIEKWKHIDHEPGENPFQPGIDLWRSGFVPSFDGQNWRLHAGPKAKIVWEGVL